MITVDTNVLVRMLIVDDADQSARARALFERSAVQILLTVLLETEWILRARAALSPTEIHRYFSALIDTSGVEFENEPRVRDALALFAQGLDFADALHLAAADRTNFASFDERLVKRARRLGRSATIV